VIARSAASISSRTALISPFKTVTTGAERSVPAVRIFSELRYGLHRFVDFGRRFSGKELRRD
jgi:hypothetical protein